jgi:hypothetical protein
VSFSHSSRSTAHGVFRFDYEHAFISGARFLLPVLPVLCVFVAVAAIAVRAGARLKAALIAVCLLGQLGASGVLTYQLRQFKGRMAAHRDLIYSATARNALVIGPHDWNKLVFARDGQGNGRRYASFETAARVPPQGQEIVRLVEDALRAGAPACVLGSGSRRTPDEDRAVAALRVRYRLVRIAETSSPYELSVDQVLPESVRRYWVALPAGIGSGVVGDRLDRARVRQIALSSSSLSWP